MRTALTLDDDVAALLERVRAERQAGLKDVVNDALRLGLRSLAGRPRRRAVYRTETVSLGRCLVGDLADVSEALAVAEGEAFR